MMATHTQMRSHDFGASWDSSSFGDDSTQSTGDFMDQYISETGEKPLAITSDDPKPQPKHDEPVDMSSAFTWDDNAAPKHAAPAPSASSEDATSGFAADMTNLFAHSSFDQPAPAPAPPAFDASSDSGWPWSGQNKRRENMEGQSHHRSLWDADSSNDASSSSSSSSNTIADTSSSATDSFSKMFSSWSGGGSSWSSNDVPAGSKSDVSMPQAAPQQQDQQMDSPIQGPTQREGSIAGASAHDQVVDVRLSSELQQSLLQARNAEDSMLSSFRGVN